MIVAESAAEVRAQIRAWKQAGLSVGLVPTMGYLHEGHASLVEKSRSLCDRTVVSVFVNPTQFGPGEDLESYPRDFAHDCALLEERGCDMVFHPDASALYPPDFATYVEICSDMPKQLCGKTRPTHFRGVCTVVTKLFNLTQAEVAVFGRKDAQQALIIKRMVRDLNMPIEIIVAPLVRDTDLVAMSSRNRYLSESERKSAQVISRSLLSAEDELRRNGIKDIEELILKIKTAITSAGGRIDYVEALDGYNLEPLTGKSSSVLLAVAAYFGTTRLIDNVLVDF